MDTYPYMPDGPGSPALSVLYVDDEPAVLKLSKRFLEKDAHFSVTAAESAREAIDLLTAHHFDAIVSDYRMPEMDGIEFLNYIRERFDDIPFIIVTGKGEEDVVIQALNLGADFYLQKGGDPDTHYATLIHNLRQSVAHRRSVQALLESEERYRNVVEDQTELISRFLPDGTHVFVNEAYCRYYQMRKEDIIGHRFSPEILPEDRKRIGELLASLTPENPVLTIEHPIIMPDGTTRCQQWSDRAIFDKAGKVIEYQSVGRDITDRKQAEEEIRFKNTLLTTQQETSLDGILVVDEEGKILSYNQQFITIWGIPDNAITTRSDGQVLGTVTDKLADPEEFLARVRDLYGKKHEKSHGEVHFKDGRVIERYSAPMWGENNRYYGRVWYFRDITERKQAEEEIRSAAIWWQRTFDAITDPIFIFEREGIILRSNIAASHILGIPLDQIVGRKCHEMVHGTSEFIPGCPYVTMLKSGVSESYSLQWNDHWFKVTTHPLYDDKGTITKAIHVMTDIDLIKRAAEERARLAAIIDSSQDAIISITLDSSIASWNESAERMFGHTADQIIGKHYNAILTDESAPVWEDAFSTLLKGESVRHGETVLLARGEKTFDASFSLSPVRDDAGELSGIAAIIRDLSEQRKAERDLVAFVTEAALRLKNPVEIIKEDLADLLRMVDSDTLSGPEISLLLHVQIRNASQILENLQALNKAIVEGHEEIPRAYREFLSG